MYHNDKGEKMKIQLRTSQLYFLPTHYYKYYEVNAC